MRDGLCVPICDQPCTADSDYTLSANVLMAVVFLSDNFTTVMATLTMTLHPENAKKASLKKTWEALTYHTVCVLLLAVKPSSHATQ